MMIHIPQIYRGCVRMMEAVYVLIRTEPGMLEDVMEKIKSVDGVTEVAAVTGAYDIITKVEKSFITDALAVVVREIRKIEGVISTETLIASSMHEE